MTAAHPFITLAADGGLPPILTDAITEAVSGAVTAGAGQATTSAAGVVPLATAAQTVTGTDTSHAVTPAGVKAAVDALWSTIVGGAPIDRDTFAEVAAIIASDETGLAAVTTALAGKVSSSTYTTGLAGKADLVGGVVPSAQLPPTSSGLIAEKGAWAPGTTYTAGDAVIALGRRWQSKAGGSSRLFAPTDWTPLSPPASLPRPNIVNGTGNSLTAQGTMLSDGVATGLNSYVPLQVAGPLGTARIRFPGFANPGTGTDTAGTDAFQFTASVQVITPSAGTIAPLYFNGQRTATMQPNQLYIDSDPVYVGATAGSFIAVRTYASVDTAGKKWIITGLAGGSGSYFAYNHVGTTETDLTLTSGTASYSTSVGAGVFAPVSVSPVDPPLSHTTWGVIAYGDSITAQNTWARRVAQANGLAWVDMAKIGATGAAVPTLAAKRLAVTPGIARHGICAYGRNDMNSPTLTRDQLIATQRKAWDAIRNSGVEVLAVVTVPPLTTSTDSWATLANQTAAANDAPRLAYNDWLRNNTGGEIDAVIDLAAALQDPTDASKWVTNGTANFFTGDGMHPTTTTGGGHDRAAPLVTADVLRLLAL